MRIADISTTLRRRFDAVRNEQSLEEIAPEIGIGYVTLCTWLAQGRKTRIEVLSKIETWVETHEQLMQLVQSEQLTQLVQRMRVHE